MARFSMGGKRRERIGMRRRRIENGFWWWRVVFLLLFLFSLLLLLDGDDCNEVLDNILLLQ